MPYVVVDTCVVSYLYSGHDLAKDYRRHVAGNTKVISFMTLAELYYGTLKDDWGEPRRMRLLTHVAHEYVLFPFNQSLCVQWAEVRNQTRDMGRQAGVADSWIAATALLYDIPLITHNHRHYEAIPRLNVVSEAP